MKAQLLLGYGGPDRFHIEDVPAPEPGPGQVRLRVRAIGINPMEAKIRSGALRQEMPTTFPAILGSDVAGVVDQVGEGVSDLAVGDRVVGLTESGAYAEEALARAEVLALIPDGLSFEQAATVPTAAETAQRAIALLAPQEGETFVVSGAAGSVGSAAVQFLVRRGVRVIGTAGEDNQDYLRLLGATPTTYGEGVVERIRALAPEGVDAVFDVTGKDFTDAAIALRGGSERVVGIADFTAASKGVTVSAGDASAITREAFAPVLDLAAEGGFVTEIAETYSFERLADAHRRSEDEHLRGKIIVTNP